MNKIISTRRSVILNNKEIDALYYDKNIDNESIKESLINHDGYNPNIIVKCSSCGGNDKKLKK
jgi:antirestriction protein